jgi:flagellar biogenesis protein FliO
MIRLIRLIVAIVVVVYATTAFSQDSGVAPSSSNIPFKTDSTPFEEHGSRVGFGLLVFLVFSGAVIYVLRKKIPAIATLTEGDSHLKIIKRAKLNPRATLYVVEFNHRKLLIGQSGDQLVCLANTEAQIQSQDNINV